METLYYDILPSPIGKILVGVTDRGLTLTHYPLKGSATRPLRGFRAVRSREKTREARRQLRLYFVGQLRRFDLPLDLRGTPFQIAVWKALRTIPYGRTTTYGQIARRIGKPGAARAVGGANHRNRIGIVLPCHRVIGAGGGLTGYAAGLQIKHALLRLERAHSRQA